MASRRRHLPPGAVRLVFPRTRPAAVNPMNQEPAAASGIYDPHVQVDIAQFAKARGDVYDVGTGQVLPLTDVSSVPEPIPTSPVVEPDRFHRTAKTPYALTSAPILAIAAAAQGTPRVFMTIRNHHTSAGYMYIDFDNSAVTPLTASYELAAGGIAFFDQFVPQGDVYLVADTTALCVVVFANGP
jgi:hypothetical protein